METGKNDYEHTRKALIELSREYHINDEEYEHLIGPFTVFDKQKKPIGFRPVLSIVCALDSHRSKKEKGKLSEYAIDLECALLHPVMRSNLEEECKKSRFLSLAVNNADDVYKKMREEGSSIVHAMQETETSVKESLESYNTAWHIAQSIAVTGGVIAAFFGCQYLTKNKNENKIPSFENEHIKRVIHDYEMDY